VSLLRLADPSGLVACIRALIMGKRLALWLEDIGVAAFPARDGSCGSCTYQGVVGIVW
jgi:hypothetical protein